MNSKNGKNADPLADLLKQELINVPSAMFSDQLLQASMNSYRVSYSRRYQKEERLGKAIIGILLLFNLMMLVKLLPSEIDRIWLTGIVVFCAGLALLIRKNIRMMKKFTRAYIA